MHFIYLDESGCTGNNLCDAQEPVFVLGGIIVRDEGWNITNERYEEIIGKYFNGAIPRGFELHADELFSPDGGKYFPGQSHEKRNALASSVLSLLAARKHQILFYAVDKKRLLDSLPFSSAEKRHVDFDSPYMIAYDYLISASENHIKSKLGSSAMGMFIIDEKKQYEHQISNATNCRRYSAIKANRIKRLTEFTYSVDSRKNPMIQLSDLVCYIIRKYCEIKNHYRPNYPPEVSSVYVSFYNDIQKMFIFTGIRKEKGARYANYNRLIRRISAAHDFAN